jgi:hypothetical protein
VSRPDASVDAIPAAQCRAERPGRPSNDARLLPPDPAAATQAALPLLRALLREDRTALAAAFDRPPAELLDVLHVTTRHTLTGWVYTVLQRLGCLGLLPPAGRAWARQLYLAQWTTSERLTHDLARVSALFAAGGVPMLALKGPLLAHRYYGQTDARAMSDLDVLVHDGAASDAADRLLRAAGFTPTYGTLLGRRLSRRFTHHFHYQQGALTVEVHWVFQRHAAFRIDYGRVWATSEQVTLRGHDYRVPSAEYEMVLRIIGALTDLQVGTLTLKPFVDLYRLLIVSDAAFDWEAFFVQRQREGVLTASLAFLRLLLDLFDCRSEFPQLAAALARPPWERHVPLAATGPVLRGVFAADRRDWRQKVAAFRLYDTSLAGALAWWALSLPFRLAVYQEGSSRLLRRVR